MQFDIRTSHPSTLPVLVFRCAACRAETEYPIATAAEGGLVSCSPCGHTVVITPDHMAWIRNRADMMGVPNQQPFVTTPRWRKLRAHPLPPTIGR